MQRFVNRYDQRKFDVNEGSEVDGMKNRSGYHTGEGNDAANNPQDQ